MLLFSNKKVYFQTSPLCGASNAPFFRLFSFGFFFFLFLFLQNSKQSTIFCLKGSGFKVQIFKCLKKRCFLNSVNLLFFTNKKMTSHLRVFVLFLTIIFTISSASNVGKFLCLKSSVSRFNNNNDKFSLLKLHKIFRNHSGNYTCEVKNLFGKDSGTFQLKVKGYFT